MRIVVSGTHASGKSTLISDFGLTHPEYSRLDDPFDDLLDEGEITGPASFLAQLTISAERLAECRDVDLIAERGPIDFLAYLLAWEELGRGAVNGGLLARAMDRTAAALQDIDLLVVLPAADDISVPDEEDPPLREAMDEVLLRLADDPELVDPARLETVTGDPAARLRQIQRLVRERTGRAGGSDRLG